MGDPKNLKSIPTSLPPGFCFHPTDEQVFCYYLSNKNNIIKNHGLYLPSTSDAEDPVLGFNVVPEIDLYSYDPCNLPDVACFPFGPGGSRKHWYCFVKAVSEREKRKAMGGFWYRKGRARDVVGGKEGSLLGTMRTFVFYRQNSKRTVKAEWVMYEYDPVDHPEEYFVLCRVFFKSRPGNKILEHVPSSFADKNVAVVHGPGIEIPYKRHDGASASGVGEIVVHGDISVDTDNEIQRLSMKLISEPENPVVAQQASDDDFQFTVVVPQPDNLVRSSSGIIRGSTVFGGAVVDELITDSVILEGDFIELNDLISPLPNIDSVG